MEGRGTMNSQGEPSASISGLEEKRLALDETRLRLDQSFAKKYLPALVTVVAGLIAAMFSFVQHQSSLEETKRAQIAANERSEREYGFKVLDMYFTQHDLFDLAENPEQAARNLRVLAALAPAAVRGVLLAEQSRIPAPGGSDDSGRLKSLAAVAGVQEALATSEETRRNRPPESKPTDYTVYIQYPAGGREIAKKARDYLDQRGYRVPGIKQVESVPSSLQVRYYRANQRSHAESLLAGLVKELGLPADTGEAIQVSSTRELPTGFLEVWFPSSPQ